MITGCDRRVAVKNGDNQSDQIAKNFSKLGIEFPFFVYHLRRMWRKSYMHHII